MGIIPGRRNQQIEMKFRGGNHPWEEEPASRDEFYGWESSLVGNLQIRMNSMAGNHPWEEKPENQDEIPGRKSSLGGEICK